MTTVGTGKWANMVKLHEIWKSQDYQWRFLANSFPFCLLSIRCPFLVIFLLEITCFLNEIRLFSGFSTYTCDQGPDIIYAIYHGDTGNCGRTYMQWTGRTPLRRNTFRWQQCRLCICTCTWPTLFLSFSWFLAGAHTDELMTCIQQPWKFATW